jgi:hypothetical protein
VRALLSLSSPPPPSLPLFHFSPPCPWASSDGQAADGPIFGSRSGPPASLKFNFDHELCVLPCRPTSSGPSIAVSWAARTPCICTYRDGWRGGREREGSGRKERRRQMDRLGSHSRRFCHPQPRSSRVCPGWSLAPCRVQMVVQKMASEQAYSHSHDACRIAGKLPLSEARAPPLSLSLGRQAANIAQSYTSQYNNKTGFQYLILSCWCPPAAIAFAALLWSACHPSLALKTTSASSRPARHMGDTSACRCTWEPGRVVRGNPLCMHAHT